MPASLSARGEVHFAGQRIDWLADPRRVELRRTAFGLVFQFGQLVPELPAAENIGDHDGVREWRVRDRSMHR